MSSDASMELMLQIQASWPAELRAGPTGAAMSELIAAAGPGLVTSLPYLQKKGDEVLWLTFGGTAQQIREYREDLEVWIRPLFGASASIEFVQSGGIGRLADLIRKASPAGYLKWRSSLRHLSSVVEALSVMVRFLASKPAISVERPPSISTLRFRFVAALRLGEWAQASSIVDEIDRWNLDQARKTLQMRIRLFDAMRDYQRLFEIVERSRAWELTHPKRISDAILVAIHEVVFRPLEGVGRFEDSLNVFRTTWFPRLLQLIADTGGASEVVTMRAYAACVDRDASLLAELIPRLGGGLGDFLRKCLPLSDAVPPATQQRPEQEEASASLGHDYWSSLVSSVRAGRQERVRSLVDDLGPQLLSDVHFVSTGPDALLELFSDPEVEASAVCRMLLHETLAGLIEAVVDVPDFPRISHLDLYLTLCEGLVSLRGESANEEDSQLLLGLVSAVASLSPPSVERCEAIVLAWWSQRPISGRLPWLAAALDVLAPLHPTPEKLVGLFVAGLDLAARKRQQFGRTELWTWRRVGSQLEIAPDVVEGLLAPLTPIVQQDSVDLLRRAGFRQIAVVSLQEAGAREAADELRQRTGAEVTVVTSLVEDASTRKAFGADLILFVWAASSHAVYRAFDRCRDRLAYVQGTGASSIVSAAEGWVYRNEHHEVASST